MRGSGLPNPNPISVQDTGWTATDIPHVLHTYRKHVVFLDTWQVGGHASLLQVGNVEFRVGTCCLVSALWLPPAYLASLATRPPCWPATLASMWVLTLQALSASGPLHMLFPHPGPLLSSFSLILFFLCFYCGKIYVA